jgi:hypothetical protein
MTHTVESLMALHDEVVGRSKLTEEGEAEARSRFLAALTETLSFNPDWADFENGRECGRLEAAHPIDTSQESVEKSGGNVQVPDPMTLMTDASIMQVAQGWREFDAPGGGNSVVYGACRAVLNKYRDLLAAIPKVAQQAEQVPSWLPLTPELLTSIEAGEFGAGGFWLATKGSSSAVYGAYEWQQGRNPHGFNDINGYRIAGAHDVTHVMSYATPSLPAAPKGGV